MTGNKIRVLVVDDSALMRKKITEMINSSPKCEVVAVAKDGYEALELLHTVKPDVITLDLQLPNMDGLTCLSFILKERPTPVIVLSAFTKEGSSMAIQALEFGAIDVVAKPGGVISPNIDNITDELLNKIQLAMKVPVEKLHAISINKAKKLRLHSYSKSKGNKVIAIGASTGGPSAITNILASLPGDLPASILLIQHMPHYFIQSFTQRLNAQIDLKVKEAENGDQLLPGTVLIAPFGFDIDFNKNPSEDFNHSSIQLKESSKTNVSPSIDAAFCAAAECYGRHLLGIILTGMGKDGTNGCLRIKELSGKTIAQDEASSIVFGMPGSAIGVGAIDRVLPLNDIPNAILDEVRNYHD